MSKASDFDFRSAAPVPGGGLEMDGYFVWCGSVIRGDDNRYHMFASRWRREFTFHPGWLTDSEVIHAVSDTPDGKFEFQSVVLPRRGPQYWDGCATHNPAIVRYGRKFLLFYTGISYPFGYPGANGGEYPDELFEARTIAARASKRIGVAVADRVEGPYVREDAPVLTTRPGTFYSYLVSNAAPVVEPDGSIFMLFKTRRHEADGAKWSNMFIGAARAAAWGEPFRVLTEEPLFGDGRNLGEVEDPFLWKTSDGKYHMIAKDMTGSICGQQYCGIAAESEDGLNWRATGEAYTLEAGGRSYALRERPWLLREGDRTVALYNAAADLFPYREPAARTWNQAFRI